MNTGTRVRGALGFAIALYAAFYKTDVTDFNNDTVNLIYQICMKIVTFVVIFLIYYYNNDVTVEGAIGTKITRELKELREFEPTTVAEPEDSEVEEDDE